MAKRSKGGGRKPRAAKTKTATAASNGGGTPIKLITASALNSLLTQTYSLQNKVDAAAGDLGDLTREYTEKKYLHKGAFSMIKRLHRMGKKDSQKLWLLLCHFDHMRDACKLDDLAEEQGQLVDAGTDQDEERGENVVDIPAREVDETPGEAA